MTLIVSITTKLYIPCCQRWPDTNEKKRVSIDHTYSFLAYVEVENGRRSFRLVNVFQADHIGAQLDLVLGQKCFFCVGHSKFRRFGNLKAFAPYP